MSAAGFTLPLYDKHIDAEHASRSVKSGIPRLSIKTPVVLLEDGQSGVDGGLLIHKIAGMNYGACSVSRLGHFSDRPQNIRNIPYNR